MVGKQISEKIRLTARLGVGGMGVVWKAEHLGLHAAVAVKLMSRGSREDAGVRFRNEAITAARLRSPHVTQVLDHGVTDDGIPYIVMELLEGEDLGRLVRRVGPLPLAEVAAIFAQAARALEKARTLEIVHRDLKPANIFLVDPDGDRFVKVLDFGVAKQHAVPGPRTLEGAVVGTPLFMSPEQIDDPGGVDWRADLWSLAATTYYALFGRVPFNGTSMESLRRRMEHQGFVLPSELGHDVPPGLDGWFQRAFARELEERFTSAHEMAEELEEIASRAGASALRPMTGSTGGSESDKTFDAPPRPAPEGGRTGHDRHIRRRRTGAFYTLVVPGLGLGIALLSRHVSPGGGRSAAPAGCEVSAPLPEPCNPTDAGGLYCGEDPMLGHAGKQPGTLYLCTKYRPGDSDRPLGSVEKVCDFGCDKKEHGIQAGCKSGRPGQVAAKLDRSPRLLFGLGDGRAPGHPVDDSAHASGLKPDIQDTIIDVWGKSEGSVSAIGRAAVEADVVPMFTYAVLAKAVRGADEAAIHRLLTNEQLMVEYWRNFIGFLFEIAGLCEPVIVHLEPGLWDHPVIRRYAPKTLQIATLATECSWLENKTPGQAPYPWNMAGLGRCLLHLAHVHAPRSMVGYHLSPSAWADPSGLWPEEHLRFIGAEDADILVVGTVDRDAACDGSPEECAGRGVGPPSWGDADFEAYLDWAKGVGERLDKSLLWWQVPLGEPGDQGVHEPPHYRHIFGHADRIAGTRTFGVVFSAGGSPQAGMTAAGRWFEQALKAYRASPAPLP